MLRFGVAFMVAVVAAGVAQAQQPLPAQSRVGRADGDTGRNCIFAGLSFTTGSFFCVGRGLLLACNTEKGPFWKHETALSNLCTEPTLRMFVPPDIRTPAQ